MQIESRLQRAVLVPSRHCRRPLAIATLWQGVKQLACGLRAPQRTKASRSISIFLMTKHTNKATCHHWDALRVVCFSVATAQDAGRELHVRTSNTLTHKHKLAASKSTARPHDDAEQKAKRQLFNLVGANGNVMRADCRGTSPEAQAEADINRRLTSIRAKQTLHDLRLQVGDGRVWQYDTGRTPSRGQVPKSAGAKSEFPITRPNLIVPPCCWPRLFTRRRLHRPSQRITRA